MGQESCNRTRAARITLIVLSGSSHRLVDIYGQMTPREVARLRSLLGGHVRRMRTLRDCPEYEIEFQPFLLTSPDDPEFVFRSGRPDTGPMSEQLRGALMRRG